jgi:hypothetical protein
VPTGSGTVRLGLVAWPGLARFSVIVLPACAAAIVTAEMVTALHSGMASPRFVPLPIGRFRKPQSTAGIGLLSPSLLVWPHLDRRRVVGRP